AGLALMWEILYITASLRMPVILTVVNRALSGNINIHCDHSDTMGARDAGWIQLYSENCQEAYDNSIQAVRIAEHPDVRLPVMVCLDGFILSHTLEGLETNDDEAVRNFIGEYELADSLLNVEEAQTFGAFALQNYYFEFKKQQADAMERAPAVVEQIGREYGELSGRPYGLLDAHRCEDADLVLVGLGSTMGTAKQAADDLREAEGIKCGVLKVRCFRPFPGEQIRQALKGAAIVGVMDRAVSFGLGGPLFHEIRSAFYGETVGMLNFIYGLGGRDLSLSHAKDLFRALLQAADSGQPEPTLRYIGLRE
ncbi:MAG: pyruvate ferredoxin oxidoreductase, partial [Candidatus Brocadiae bacterium]|nr:pyruvate ferredoxin oxidoreductase [Candidatus Brocadiia bacterium]